MMNTNTKKGRKKAPPIPQSSLKCFKYFKVLTPILQKLKPIYDHHNRTLHYDQYISLLLFYFFNPIITSLRAISQVSELKKVQKILGVKKSSLASLSEAGTVFDSKLLAPLIKELADKSLPLETDPKLKNIQKQLVAVDGSLLPALPKILWALWLDKDHRAAKMHLEFDIIKNVPIRAELTNGNGNEKENLRNSLTPDKLYILDAGYGQYKLFNDIHKIGSNFVARLHDNAVWKTIESRSLSKDDQAAGVERDMIVQLGSPKCENDISDNVRIIEIFHKGSSNRKRKSRVSSKKTFRTTESDYTMLLCTDRMDLPAEVIALIYRYRWQVELYFRWFKCVLGFNHFLAYSENGLTLQMYCALIASMLISLWTGRKPTKRTLEMLQYHFIGLADDEELSNHIEKLKKIDKNI